MTKITTNSKTQYIPINAMTCVPYSKPNAERLTAAAEKMNVLDDPRWLTYVQLTDLELKVKEGSKGISIVFDVTSGIKMPAEYFDDTKDYYEAEDMDSPLDWLDEGFEDDVKEYLATRSRPLKDRAIYTVFHASQVEGLPASYGSGKVANVYLNDWLEFLQR